MRKLWSFFAFFIFLFGQSAQSQSYLPNTDFSDLNICCEYRVSCAPMGWWTSSGGTFNFKPIVYKNRKPVPMPAYIRMQGQKEINERSYIQAPLLCPLQKGEEYELEIEYSFPDQSYAALGVYFSDSFIHIPRKVVYQVDSLTGSFRKYEIDSLLPFQPQQTFELNRGWIRKGTYTVRLVYQASGSEKFILLGNFLDDENSHPQKGPLNQHDGRQDLLAIHSIQLKSVSGIPCDCEQQIEILETLNRRHTYYGACHDSSEINMNLLFSGIQGWGKEEKIDNDETPNLPFQGEKAYRIDGIYFDFDSSTLRPESFPVLDSLASIFKNYIPYRIAIVGHTDSMGSDAYNDSLSLHRAQAVRAYLIEAGIHPEKIVAIGKGSKNPVENNGNEEGRQANRRVEFILQYVPKHTR